MGITLEGDTDDFIKNTTREIFKTACDFASRKIREAGLETKEIL